jgi:hypothetical protein
MNRIAAFALAAASIVAPTLAHAESGAPTREERRTVATSTKEGWIRILPATNSPLFPVATPSLSQAFGVRFDRDAIQPAPTASTPRLMNELPAIPLVVFKF